MTPIDKDELLKALRQRYDNLKQWYERANEDAKANASAAIAECFEIGNIVKGQPTVRTKGTWVDFSMSTEGVPIELCGNCKRWSYEMMKNYCPHCGADMRGEQDG